MSWQDIALTIANLSFAIALLPSVFSKDKPAVATSLLTVAGLTVTAVTFASLSLWFSMTVVLITAMIWLTLAFQVMLRRHPKLKG